MDNFDKAERDAKEALAQLQREFEKLAKPIIDRLVQLQCCKQPEQTLFDELQKDAQPVFLLTLQGL